MITDVLQTACVPFTRYGNFITSSCTLGSKCLIALQDQPLAFDSLSCLGIGLSAGTTSRDKCVMCAVHLPGHLVQFQRCKGATPKQHLESTLRRLHVPPQWPVHQRSACPHASCGWPCPHRNPSGELLHPYRLSASCRCLIHNICSVQCFVGRLDR